MLRGHAIVALTAALTSGCASQAIPAELFTVDAEGADYPFMLSRVEAPPRGGRPIAASSGMESAQSSSTYTAGNTTVTVTQTSAARSELGASTKLAAQVRRADRWVAFEGATYEATDFSTYGAASASRRLSIQARAYR